MKDKMIIRILKLISCLLFTVICFVSTVGTILVKWYGDNFGEKLAMVIFTVRHAEGANMDIVGEAVRYCLPGIIAWVVLTAAFVYAVCSKKAGKKVYVLAGILCLAGLTVFFIYSDQRLKVIDYISSQTVETDLFEKYYVMPDIDRITAEDPKNLIYIYLESMETTYASADVGGFQKDANYIPNLTGLALENISFSNTDKLGGFLQVNGTGWTAAATFASMIGAPYLAPTTDVSAGFKALNSFGDILKANGYYLEYICGSDADFSGRRLFLEKQGEYEIMDYQASIDKGYIDPDYFVWWGYEDENLYRIAQSEITEHAAKGDPFDITILTVDTHYSDGYVCELCGYDYDDQFSNVVKCADNQLGAFIDWCSTQDWYDDTVIVIQGDHPYMRKTPLVDGVPTEKRATYNCFINTDADKSEVNEKNRVFTCMDMMPTTLSALGFKIPGDRLGLGTDLFSDTPTLAEELGLDKLDSELNKHSSWYLENIVPVN